MDIEKIFYMLFSVLILLVILHILSTLLNNSEVEPSKVVLVPGFNNLFSRPFFRRRSYFHGLPWVGPRVGGYFVGPFGRRFRRHRKH